MIFAKKFFSAIAVTAICIVIGEVILFFTKPVVNIEDYSPDISFTREKGESLTFEDGNLYFTRGARLFFKPIWVKERLNSREIPQIISKTCQNALDYVLNQYEYFTEYDASKEFECLVRKDSETSEIVAIQEDVDSACGYDNIIFAFKKFDGESEIVAYNANSLEEIWRRNIGVVNAKRIYAFSDNILVLVSNDTEYGNIYIYDVADNVLKKIFDYDDQTNIDVCFSGSNIYYSYLAFRIYPYDNVDYEVRELWRYNVETEKSELLTDFRPYKILDISGIYSFDSRYIWIEINPTLFKILTSGYYTCLLRLDTETLELEVIR